MANLEAIDYEPEFDTDEMNAPDVNSGALTSEAKLTPVDYDPFEDDSQGAVQQAASVSMPAEPNQPIYNQTDFIPEPDPIARTVNPAKEIASEIDVSPHQNGDIDLLDTKQPFLEKNAESTTLEQFGAGATNALLGMSESIWRSPDALKRGYGALYGIVTGKDLPDQYNPISYISDGFSIGDTKIEGTTHLADQIDDSIDLLGSTAQPFKDVANKGNETNEAFDKLLEGEFDPLKEVIQDPDTYAAFIGQAVPSLFAAWKSGGSIPFMAWLEGMDQASNAADFEEATGQKISDEDFSSAVLATGLINGLLEKSGLEKVFGGTGSLIKRFFTGMLGEGTTELLQAGTQNVAEKYTYNPDASLTKGMLPGLIGGMGTGGPAAVASHLSGSQDAGQQPINEVPVKGPDLTNTASLEPEPVSEPEMGDIPEPTAATEIDRRFDDQPVVDEHREDVRRIDPGMRKLVNEMSPEEMANALLTSDKSGLRNERAYESEDPRLKHQSFFDIDDFKNVNDRMTYDGADLVIAEVGRIMNEEAGETNTPYHLHGDEFITQSNNDLELSVFSQKVQSKLKDSIIEFTLPDGTVITEQGIGVSYGIGKTKEQAESNLKRDKQRRKDEGVRVGIRSETGGESVSVHGQITEGNQDNEGDDTGEKLNAHPGKKKTTNSVEIGSQSVLDQTLNEAATSPNNNLPHPTEAQLRAGNYKKAHIKINELDIAIENPKGSTRAGTDSNGKAWSTKIQHSYGYIKKTEAADSDHLDVFIGPEPENKGRPVFIVDQIDPVSKQYDEAKILLGFKNKADARRAYLSNYEKEWGGLGAIRGLEYAEFKSWLKDGDTTKPLSPQVKHKKQPVKTVHSEETALVNKKHPGIKKKQSSKALSEQPRTGAESRDSMRPGDSYVGLINDAKIDGKPASSKRKVIRREDVLAPFLKALNVPLYQGRVKGKGRLGFYIPEKEAVRIKRMSDLEVTAHELGHLLDDRIPEIKKQWSPGLKSTKAVREELKGISYDKSKIYEGYAEFVRLYLTQNAKAKETAPVFYQWFKSFMANHEYGSAIDKARDDMHAWYEQDAIDRAKSKIGQSKNVNEALDSLGSRFRQAVSDDFEGVYRMERDLTGGISPVGPYETSRLSRAAYSITEGAMTIGRPVVNPDRSFSFKGKGLQQILDPVSNDIDNWTLYATGRSARELMLQGREHLFTSTEIKAMVDLETPEFKKAFDEYQKWNQGILDFAQSLGLINKESRKQWQRTQYIPFHRVNDQKTTKRKGGVEGNWDGIQALTGGTGNLSDILGNMINNASTLIGAALKNEARVEIADMVDKERGGGRFMIRIPKDTKSVKIDKEQIQDAIYKSLGVSPSMARMGHIPEQLQVVITTMETAFSEEPGLMEFWMPGQSPKGDNVIAVLRNGKPEFYEVADPLLYRAISALNRPGKHWLVSVLSVFKRIGQSSITLTADFMAANIARDTIMGGIISRHGFKPFVDSIKGMKSRLAEDKTYEEFIANGGGFSSYLVDEDAFKTHLEKFYTKKGIDYKTVIDLPGKALYALETITDAFEMSTRLGEYKQARKKGEHPRHAAYSAREVSTDFAMRGDSQVMNFFYDTVMFLKAGINGMDRLYRGVAHDPNKMTIATKTGVLALISMGLYALNRDNELYDKLEDWDKDTHWHFFIAKVGTDENTPIEERYHHFRYPKIWEIGAVASISERTMEQLMNAKDADGKKLSKDLSRITLDMFNLSFIPQAGKPLLEQAMNKNLFTKRPIENQSMQSLAPYARSGPYTNHVLTEAGLKTRDLPRELQISPVRAEALLRGYFNTWAMYGLMMADAITRDDKANLRADQYPVLRRFYADEPAKHTKYETMFYDMLRDATELRRTMRAMDKKYRPDIADEIEQKPEVVEYNQLVRANKELQAINREIRLVYISPIDEVQKLLEGRYKKDQYKLGQLRNSEAWNDTGKLKRLAIDDFIKERNELLKAVVEDVEDNSDVKVGK